MPVSCEAWEALGQAPKENKGQADLCVHICKLLTTGVPPQTNHTAAHSIVVLMPHTRQAELLKRLLSRIPQSIEVSSIDGFQGREADVVAFVTVRCNEHRNIDFPTDMRRMNMAPGHKCVPLLY
jgi:regulator of nonsense transcripts 1